VKNSFFLVIPEQQKRPDLSVSFESASIEQWINDLPVANPGLSTRLLYEFIKEFNTVKMPIQQRLDVLEALTPSFQVIEDYLRSRLIHSGFPKGDSEQKIFDLLISIEKTFTIGYWMVVRELTKRHTGWFQGKNIALAIQRTIRGLSQIVVSHYTMFFPVPDWVWIDLHSLYKLSVKTKKDTIKVTDSNHPCSIEDCYKQVLLLSLTDPAGLMQKEVKQVYEFIDGISSTVQIEQKPVVGQQTQCTVLTDEDVAPQFDDESHSDDTSVIYLNLLKLYQRLEHEKKFGSQSTARFSSMIPAKQKSTRLPYDLFSYVKQSWSGIRLEGTAFFGDRLDRYIVVGVNATHALQSSLQTTTEVVLELLAESYSDRELSCQFEQEGVLSIGSLVSFRKVDEPETKRGLGIVKKITMSRQSPRIAFELTILTPLSYAVEYTAISANAETERQKALLYGVKTKNGEKTLIIMESFRLKNEDILRMYMNNESFPIILGERKNIGLGYWQFECRRMEEKQIPKSVKKKGYDFI